MAFAADGLTGRLESAENAELIPQRDRSSEREKAKVGRGHTNVIAEFPERIQQPFAKDVVQDGCTGMRQIFSISVNTLSGLD